MGFFDSVKKSLGLAHAEMELRVPPDSVHVAGELRGELVLKALKDIEIFGVDVALLHGFRDEWGGITQDIFEQGTVVEMASMSAGEEQAFPFFIEIPATVAPSLGPFSWKVQANARLKGAADLHIDRTLTVHFSPIVGAIFDIVQNQFGFVRKTFGADEECLWAEFSPTGAIKNMYRQLEVAYDERDHEIALWISLEPFSARVLERYREDYDPSENSIEIILDKRQYIAGTQVDTQGLLGILQPIFSP